MKDGEPGEIIDDIKERTARIRKEIRSIRVSVAIAAVLLLTSFLGSLVEVGIKVLGKEKQKEDVTLERRIDELSNSLLSAAKTISEIEAEVSKRQDLAAKLQADAEQAQRIAELNKEQVEALTQALRGELEKDDTRAFWFSVAQNAVFMLLGLGLGEILHHFRLRRRLKTAEAEAAK